MLNENRFPPLIRWLFGRKLREEQERNTINRLNCGHEVKLEVFTFHVLLRPKPTDSLMIPGPAMEAGMASHCHIYCWSRLFTGRMPRPRDLGTGNKRWVGGTGSWHQFLLGPLYRTVIFFYHFYTWYHEFSIPPAHIGKLGKTGMNCFLLLFIPLTHSGLSQNKN